RRRHLHGGADAGRQRGLDAARRRAGLADRRGVQRPRPRDEFHRGGGNGERRPVRDRRARARRASPAAPTGIDRPGLLGDAVVSRRRYGPAGIFGPTGRAVAAGLGFAALALLYLPIAGLAVLSFSERPLSGIP